VEVKLSFRGADDLGFTEIDYLKSKSATADLVGGEPESIATVASNSATSRRELHVS